MKRLSKEEKIEKKRLKKENRDIKKETKKLKKEEKDIVKEVKKKGKEFNKNILVIIVIVLLLVCLLLSSVSSLVLTKKLNKLENKYNALSNTNDRIMEVLNTDDGTGDKISNINTELETIKGDIVDLMDSDISINTKIDENTKSISSYNNKMKAIDETKLNGLYSFYDWNKGLNIRYNYYNSYSYCAMMAVRGEIPDHCK